MYMPAREPLSRFARVDFVLKLRTLGGLSHAAVMECRLKDLRDIARRLPKWRPSIGAMRIQRRRKEQVGAFAGRQLGEVRRRNQPAPRVPLRGVAIVMLHEDGMLRVRDESRNMDVGLDQLRGRGGCAPMDGDRRPCPSRL